MIIEAPSDSSPFLPGKLVDAVAHATNIIAISPKNSEVSNLLGESYPYLGDSKKMPDIKEALWNAYENWLAGSLSHPRIGELKSSFSPSKVLEPLK